MLFIVGVRERSFSFDNYGQHRVVHGYQVFCTDDSNSTDDSNNKVDGLSTLDFFLSDSVCSRSSFTPFVGARIETIFYNKFGKIFSVVPASE